VSEFAANPADVVEQEQDLAGDVPEAEEPVDIPVEANEADVVEQAIEVPEDDEDHRG
jgi:hypothetical protein